MARLALLVAGVALACAGPPGAARLPSAALAPLRARVEAARGSEFRARVRALAVPQEAVSALLAAEVDRVLPPDAIAEEQALAQGLGLLPAGIDLRAAALRFQSESIAGFYSQSERRLYVVTGVGPAAGVDADTVLVHELAHALQDQHSDLLGVLLGLRDDDDVGFALSALLEGEATYVELEDGARASGRERLTPAALAARFAHDAEATDSVPRLLRESIVRAYPLGYALADALARRGGARGLDSAEANPPLSSEELLHPERYLEPARRVPVAVLPRAAAGPGCDVLASNSYGELGVRVWLREAGLADAEAGEAADGWDGDRAWRFACASELRVAWLIQHDAESEARQLEAAMRGRLEWRGELPLRVDRAGARVLLSGGLAPAERERLLALPEERRVASLAEYLAARPEVKKRARALRR